MPSSATTSVSTPTSIPFITPNTTPATSDSQQERKDTPDSLGAKRPALNQDFHLDTFFNPVWTPSPHVFSFAKNGTVVPPKTYAPEPYPGYHADRSWCLGSGSVDASQSKSRVRGDPKPWKNVAITEQDDAEWEAMLERAKTGAVGERGRHSPYGPMPFWTPE